MRTLEIGSCLGLTIFVCITHRQVYASQIWSSGNQNGSSCTVCGNFKDTVVHGKD